MKQAIQSQKDKLEVPVPKVQPVEGVSNVADIQKSVDAVKEDSALDMKLNSLDIEDIVKFK
jgi:hypothetical protein